MNEKRFLRFWVAVIIASIIISLMGCKPCQNTTTDDTIYLPDCGVYTEFDTVVNSDTLYYWKKE